MNMILFPSLNKNTIGLASAFALSKVAVVFQDRELAKPHFDVR
jgi:hypothetical protein